MANPFTVEPLGGLQGMQQIYQGMGNIADTYQQNQAEEKKRQLMGQAREIFERGSPQEIAQFSLQNPEIGQALQGATKFASDATKQNLKSSMQEIIAGRDPVDVIQRRAQMVRAEGGDPSDTLRDLELAQQDPEAYRDMIARTYALEYGETGVPGFETDQTPARLKTFNELVDLAQNSSDPFVRESARRELGAKAKEGTLSSKERIAAEDQVGEQVAAQAGREAGATEEAKLETQLAIKPKIERAVREAEDEAKREGEALSEYGRAQASMPGLREVVNKLKTLSDVATYTMGGKVFDTMVKELGFGATEGATARAKMESLVNNQILPLLRDTFGAQFTEREGEQLRRTMLDIDAAPEQKKQILDSFIEQKMRDLEMKRGRVEETGSAAEAQQTNQDQTPVRIRLDAQGNIIQ